jgi:hypothetical protein
VTGRRPALPLALSVLIAGAASSCGASSSTARQPPWRAGHPDQPSGCDPARSAAETGHCTVQFQDASGLCAVSVQFPDAAPGVVLVEGTPFLQRGRSTPASAPAGARRLATSGDWILDEVTPSQLSLVTPQAVFDYRSGASC